MKRFMPLSLAIHMSLIFYVAAMDPETKPEKVEVEIELAGNEDKASKNGRDVKVIEQLEGPGEKVESKNYYWGIGISGDYYLSKLGYVYLIKYVYGGYSAESAGLLPGDNIIKVNGKSPLDEDISGSGPGGLILEIIRDGRTLTFKLQRVKVLY